jgi:hypothetical protein
MDVQRLPGGIGEAFSESPDHRLPVFKAMMLVLANFS